MDTKIIQKAQKTGVTNTDQKSLQAYIKSMQSQIALALPEVMTPERFTRILLTAVSNTPKLAQCTPASFLGSMMAAAQLGLEPNTNLGHVYLIPYQNYKTGTYECQLQIGYKGLLELAWRSGKIVSIQAQTVYENDKFEYEYGLNPDLKHIPAMSDRGRPVAYYATYRTKDGGFGFEVMSKEDIDAVAKNFSKAGTGPWKDHYDAMAKKTVLKRVLKYAPLSAEFARQVVADETVKHFGATDGNGELIKDMFEVPEESLADFDVDPETGEVSEVK